MASKQQTKNTLQLVVSTKAPTKKNNGNGAGKPARQRRVQTSNGLDQNARAWARLVADPCYAPLTHPIYPGSDGGLLARFESEQTFGAGAGETGFIVGFVPGLPGGSIYANATALASDTTNTLFNNTSIAGPGQTFLSTSASAVRCVAACMQISWPGSELDRQGYITLGQCSGGLLSQGLSVVTNTAALRPLCHLRARVPDTFLEVKWRPTLGDAEWHDPSLAGTVGDINKKGAIFATVSNLKALIGARVRFIVTYEWQPKTNQGVATAFDSHIPSKNSLDDVINALDKNGPGWAYRATTAFNAVSGMASAFNRANNAGRMARGSLMYY